MKSGLSDLVSNLIGSFFNVTTLIKRLDNDGNSPSILLQLSIYLYVGQEPFFVRFMGITTS